MPNNKFNSRFIDLLKQTEKGAKRLGKTQKELLIAIGSPTIGMVRFKNGESMFIGIEDGMIGNLGRGLKIDIPNTEVLKDPLKLQQHLEANASLKPIKRIDMI